MHKKVDRTPPGRCVAVEERGSTGNLPPLWVCPSCGARLVSRNLWHSCVQLTLDELFARSDPPVLEVARTYVSMLHSLGDVQVIAQKTRLSVCWGAGALGSAPREDGFLANFSLHRWLDEPWDRLKTTELRLAVAQPRRPRTVSHGPRRRTEVVRSRNGTTSSDSGAGCRRHKATAWRSSRRPRSAAQIPTEGGHVVRWHVTVEQAISCVGRGLQVL